MSGFDAALDRERERDGAVDRVMSHRPEDPRVSGDDAIKALERLGFVRIRQKGSHVILRRGSTGCVVPLHRELKLGTLSGVLKQAGVTVDDFSNAL